MLIAPTEPPSLRALGTVSMYPESHGVDLIFVARGRWFGVQRKEFSDLLASMTDGRIGQQVSMMQGLAGAMVVIEGLGSARWADDGRLIDQYHTVTRDQIRSLLWSVRSRGIWVDQTDNLADTIRLVSAFEAWCKKPAHTSLDVRPGPVSMWGKADNRDWQLHFLQGLPGVGVELARRIVDTLGMPVGWQVTRDELLSIDGLGPKKVDRIMAMLAPRQLPMDNDGGS